MARRGARPRLAWEELADAAQGVYLALADGDEARARGLHAADRQTPTRSTRPRKPRTAAAAPAAVGPGGFVERQAGRFEPSEMRAAEAWKRRRARERGPHD